MSGQTAEALQLHLLLETWGFDSGLEPKEGPHGYPSEAPSATSQQQSMSEDNVPMSVSRFCSIWMQLFWLCPDNKQLVLKGPEAAEM